MSSFDIDVEHQAGVVVIKPTGDLDDATTPLLDDILGELVERGAPARLDFSGVERLDEDAVRPVLDAHGLPFP